MTELGLLLLKKLQLSSAFDDAAQFRVIHSVAFELLAHFARLRQNRRSSTERSEWSERTEEQRQRCELCQPLLSHSRACVTDLLHLTAQIHLRALLEQQTVHAVRKRDVRITLIARFQHLNIGQGERLKARAS